jgi:hypothetical protein
MFSFVPSAAKRVIRRVALVAAFGLLHEGVYACVDELSARTSVSLGWLMAVLRFPASLYHYLQGRYFLPGLADLPRLCTVVFWGIVWSYVFTWLLGRWRTVSVREGAGNGSARVDLADPEGKA